MSPMKHQTGQNKTNKQQELPEADCFLHVSNKTSLKQKNK